MKNSICLFLGLFVILSFFSACEKDNDTDAPNLEGEFTIKGLISDESGSPMENIQVKLRKPNLAHPSDDYYLISPSLKTVVTGSDGRYTISYPKKDLDRLEKRDNEIPFALSFSYEGTPSFNKFIEQWDHLSPFNLNENELIYDKELPGGAFLTVIMKDNPNIEYADPGRLEMDGTIQQGSTPYRVDWVIGSYPNMIINRLRVNEEVDIELKWEFKDGNTSIEVIEEVLQMEQGEERVYWLEY